MCILDVPLWSGYNIRYCCRALTEALDKSKKKYQAKIRRLEQQMLGLLGPAPDTLSTSHSRGSGHRAQDIS